MTTEQRVYDIINRMHKEGKEINKSTIIINSLFSSGGTLGEADNDIIMDVIWEIKDKIAAKTNGVEGITGLAYGVECNAFFGIKGTVTIELNHTPTQKEIDELDCDIVIF